MRGFRDSEGGVFKSLVRFTRFWEAVIGVLMTPENGDLHFTYPLGIDSPCVQSLVIRSDSELHQNVLSKRYVLLIKRPMYHVEYFRDLCSEEELAYFANTVFVPVVFRGRDTYALLAFREPVTHLLDVFRKIVPRLGKLNA
jgi:hypothetical protein